MHILIIGSSGMVGGHILQQALEDSSITQLSSIVRKKSGLKHPKLREIVHSDFLDFSAIADFLTGHDHCFYCVGVYTGQVGREEFRKITVDYTKAFAAAFKLANPKAGFSFLSGAGADSKERSPMMFAKDKGIAENYLKSLDFQPLHIFRPGYIYPEQARKEPNFSYSAYRFLYRSIFMYIAPKLGIPSKRLASAMLNLALNGGNKTTYEHLDIWAVEE